MYSTICIVSQAGNCYLYDFIKKELRPCHPLIHVCCKLDREQQLDTVHSVTESQGYAPADIEFYRGKYDFLKSQGWFSSLHRGEFVKYDAQAVKECLSNVRQVVFEVTDGCNLQCAYCANRELYNMHAPVHNTKMTFDTVKGVIDYLAPLWSSGLNKSSMKKVIIGFYGGEPLLNFPLIEKSVAYCKSLHLPTRSLGYNMTTNAMLLDKYIDFLVENEFNITISLDGDEEGQSYRVDAKGNNSFHKVYHTLKNIQKTYPEFWEKCISFNSVLHNRNSVERTHKFIYEEFGKVPEIHAMNNSGVRPEKQQKFNEMYVPYIKSVQEGNDDLLKERFMSDPRMFNLAQILLWYGDNQFFDNESFLYYEKPALHAKTGTCFPFSRKIYITAEGKIMVCERIAHHYALGNVVDGKVLLDLEKAADTYNEYNARMYQQCGNCYLINGCHQCIFQLNGLYTGTQVCKMYQTESDMVDYLQFYVDLLESREFEFGKIFKEAVLS